MDPFPSWTLTTGRGEWRDNVFCFIFMRSRGNFPLKIEEEFERGIIKVNRYWDDSLMDRGLMRIFYYDSFIILSLKVFEKDPCTILFFLFNEYSNFSL